MYSKTVWKDRVVQYPKRYTSVVDGSYTTFTNAEGTITEAGTPLSAVNLNKAETGIFNSTYANSETPIAEITTNMTYAGGNLTEVQELESAVLLRKTTLTYTGENVNTVNTKVYSTDGMTVIKEWTDTISYSGGNISSVARTIIT